MDLEERLEKIDRKLDEIQLEIQKLILWKIKVAAYASGVAAATVALMKAFRIL
jgi:hypothetical protein